MNDTADLELSLKRREPADNSSIYSIETRFSEPDADSDARAGINQPLSVSLNLEALNQAASDPAAYAILLSGAFFTDPGFRAEFARIRGVVASKNYNLRIRLLIDYSAQELHALRWECLLDPDKGVYLFQPGKRLSLPFPGQP